jgi:alkyl sulfatase BDS1-like metallo-beta-lactamase superfamily hydrolase
MVSRQQGSSGLRVADQINSGVDQEHAILRAPRIWESRGIGNSYLLTTSAGDVLVNAGTLADAKRGRELFQKISSNRIRTIVLTQSHANQYGGLEIYKTPDNIVIAHQLYPKERAYNKALEPYYRRGSRRIFGGITGPTQSFIPTREVPPDLLIGDEGYTFTLGDRKFEIIWTPGGETRSAVIVWLPQERTAIIGNLLGPLVGNYPNLNTLRGDKPRSAQEFIDSASILRALKPALVLTGHEVISGADKIETVLTRTIDAVKWLLDKTIEGMNEGQDLRSLMRTVKPPREIALTEEYGRAAWNVRAIWHEYTGWFDPSRGTTELYEVSPASIAYDIVELAGGTGPLTKRAKEHIAKAEPLQALHLLDIVLGADPNDAEGRDTKRDALNILLEQTGGKNLWERRWLQSEIRALDE